MWEVAIQEVLPQNCSSTVAGNSAACTVVADKECKLQLGHQMQIGVEINRIAAMPDNVQPVAILFVEPKRHGVHACVKPIGARMHELCGFRLKDLCAVELSVLQVSHGKLCHIVR